MNKKDMPCSNSILFAYSDNFVFDFNNSLFEFLSEITACRQVQNKVDCVVGIVTK